MFEETPLGMLISSWGEEFKNIGHPSLCWGIEFLYTLTGDIRDGKYFKVLSDRVFDMDADSSGEDKIN